MKLSKSTLETLVTLGAGMAAVVAHEYYTRKTKKKTPQFLFVLPASIAASYLGWRYIPRQLN